MAQGPPDPCAILQGLLFNLNSTTAVFLVAFSYHSRDILAGMTVSSGARRRGYSRGSRRVGRVGVGVVECGLYVAALASGT